MGIRLSNMFPVEVVKPEAMLSAQMMGYPRTERKKQTNQAERGHDESFCGEALRETPALNERRSV